MHAVKYSKPFFVLILIFMAYSSWKSKIHDLIILEYYTQPLKKKGFIIQNCQLLKEYVNVCTQYLVWDHFEQNCSSMGRGMKVISLWYCWGVMEAQVCFDSGLKLICVVGSAVSTLPLDNTTQILCGVEVSQLAGQLSPVIPWSVHQLPVVLALWAGAKCFWLKENLISIKLVNLRKHKVL